MSGHNSKESFGDRAERFEKLALWSGITVGVGLLIESGPELARNIITKTRPSHEIVGGLVVTVGVTAEVICSWRALRWARRAEAEAEESIAKSLERATKAEQATAEAEVELANLKKAQQPRWLDHDGFVSDLKGKPTGTAILLYQPNDSEAFSFAFQLTGGLRAAGWSTSLPIPIPDTLRAPDHEKLTPEQQAYDLSLPPIVRATGLIGPISLGTWSLAKEHTVEGTAFDALSSALGATQGSKGVSARMIEALPANTFWVVIGSKP